MSALIALARAVHFGSAVLLLGGLVFALAIRFPVGRSAGSAMERGERVAMLRVAEWGLAASVASVVAWLALEAISMSGLSPAVALGPDTLARVLANTNFGRVWLLRVCLAVACAGLLVASRRSTDEARAQRMALGALIAAAVYIAALAWSGHAGAAEGFQRRVQLPSDVIHLLAAGAWLGALPRLVLFLGRSPLPGEATSVVRRFSTMGVAIVIALALTGVVNAWFLVGSVSAMYTTDYGQLLLAKLVLFAVMVALAAVNRLLLTPRMAARDPNALHLLRRNAALEAAAGAAVMIIVGVLGITIPAEHQMRVAPGEPAGEHQPAIRGPGEHVH